MFLSRVAAILRYLISIGLGFAATAVSVMFLFEAPASVRSDVPPAIATIKSVARTSSLPQLKASDFDIARTVPVVIAGKADPMTTAAPVEAMADVSGKAKASTPGELPAQGQAMVTGDAVNVRSGPSKGSTKLFVIRSGQVVDVFESEGGWSRIAGPDGSSGWIATKFLQR